MFLYMFSTIYPYLSLLFSHFVFLFSSFLFLLISPWDTFYNLLNLIRFHYNLPIKSRRWKTFMVHKETKSVELIMSKTNTLIYIIKFRTKFELFLPSSQINFSLACDQVKIFLNYPILMNIFIYILLCDKKNLWRIFHKEKHFKITKEHVLFSKMYFK